MTRRPTRHLTVAAAIVGTLAVAMHAEAPHVYAIRGARVFTAAGPELGSGTVLVRSGLIEGVGTDVAIPSDARVIEGKGLVVYPGLIDMGATGVVEDTPNPQPAGARTREEFERWKRSALLRPQIVASDQVTVDALELTRRAATGVTTVLAIPPGEVISGHSALVNVAAPEEDPQIGDVAVPRRGLVVVKTPVALHVAFPDRPRGEGYPESLMGVVAFVRQAFQDGQHYQLAWTHHERNRAAAPRPVYDPSLLALGPAVRGTVPVAFAAHSEREIVRVLRMAAELRLKPVIAGGRESDRVISDLKAGNVPVLLSLNYPARSRTLAPDADEPLRVLRERAAAPRTAAALEKAAILFAFQSAGLREPRDFLRNAARAVKEGLPADAAVRALTIHAARIAGASDRLGSIERGKIANVIVTDGDLFDEKTRIRHVFVDGRLVAIEPPADTPGR